MEDAALAVTELADETWTGSGGQAPLDPDGVEGRGDEIARHERFS